jgi:hypothetical protein
MVVVNVQYNIVLGMRMFLGLPDPDRLVGGMDPDPDPDPIFLHEERRGIRIH